jgi:hypothetical protein
VVRCIADFRTQRNSTQNTQEFWFSDDVHFETHPAMSCHIFISSGGGNASTQYSGSFSGARFCGDVGITVHGETSEEAETSLWSVWISLIDVSYVAQKCFFQAAVESGVDAQDRVHVRLLWSWLWTFRLHKHMEFLVWVNNPQLVKGDHVSWSEDTQSWPELKPSSSWIWNGWNIGRIFGGHPGAMPFC